MPHANGSKYDSTTKKWAAKAPKKKNPKKGFMGSSNPRNKAAIKAAGMYK